MTPAESNVALAVTRYRRAASKRPDSHKTMRLKLPFERCVPPPSNVICAGCLAVVGEVSRLIQTLQS